MGYFLTYFLFPTALIFKHLEVESSEVNHPLLSNQLLISRTLLTSVFYNIKYKKVTCF